MITFKQFLESRGSSGNKQAIAELVASFKSVLKDYDPGTRRKVWKAINSVKGQKLMDRLVRSPKAPVSISDFMKLVG